MDDVLATAPSAKERAFRHLLDTTGPQVVAEVAGVVGDRALATQVTREAFLRLWPRWWWVRRLDDPAGWVLQAAVDLADRPAARAAPGAPPALRADEIVATARRRSARLLTGTGAAAVVGALVVGAALRAGSGEDGTPSRPAPSSDPAPATEATDPPTSPVNVYPPNVLDGHWTSRILVRDRVSGVRDLPPGRFRLVLVVRSSAAALWVARVGSDQRQLHDFVSFTVTGQRVEFTPVGSSGPRTSYDWQISGDRLRFSTAGERDGPDGLWTAAPFVRDG